MCIEFRTQNQHYMQTGDEPEPNTKLLSIHIAAGILADQFWGRIAFFSTRSILSFA